MWVRTSAGSLQNSLRIRPWRRTPVFPAGHELNGDHSSPLAGEEPALPGPSASRTECPRGRLPSTLYPPVPLGLEPSLGSHVRREGGVAGGRAAERVREKGECNSCGKTEEIPSISGTRIESIHPFIYLSVSLFGCLSVDLLLCQATFLITHNHKEVKH